jgi:hypothetical protein
LRLELNAIHQLFIYADDVNLLGDNIDTITKNTQTLTDASKEVGLEVRVNAQKTKCLLLPRHQNAGQNHDIKTGDTIKTTSFTPPSVIKLHLLYAHAFTCFGFFSKPSSEGP